MLGAQSLRSSLRRAHLIAPHSTTKFTLSPLRPAPSCARLPSRALGWHLKGEHERAAMDAQQWKAHGEELQAAADKKAEELADREAAANAQIEEAKVGGWLVGWTRPFVVRRKTWALDSSAGSNMRTKGPHRLGAG